MECTGRQQKNCLSVLKIKGYESIAKWRDLLDKIPKEGASVFLKFEASTVTHGCVLMNQRGNSLTPLLFAFLWRLHYITGIIDYIMGNWFNLQPLFITWGLWNCKFQPSNQMGGSPGKQPPSSGAVQKSSH